MIIKRKHQPNKHNNVLETLNNIPRELSIDRDLSVYLSIYLDLSRYIQVIQAVITYELIHYKLHCGVTLDSLSWFNKKSQSIALCPSQYSNLLQYSF